MATKTNTTATAQDSPTLTREQLLAPLSQEARQRMLGLAAVYDACDEATYRLNVVLRLLDAHDCTLTADAEDEDPQGGYDLAIACEQLRAVRALLQQALDKHRAQERGGDDAAATT